MPLSEHDGTEDLAEVIADYEALFELQRRRINGAQRMMRLAGACDEDTLPDLGKLILWLVGRVHELERELVAVGGAGREREDLGDLPAASMAVGAWVSAALDDPKVCDEMKADIRAWMAAIPEGWFPAHL